MSLLSNVTRLGKHHFTHLRAVAMGVPYQAAALRYLGIHHGHQAITAHRLTVDAVRAVARRNGERAWRLIGLVIQVDKEQARAPTLAEFAAERELEAWSESDIQQFYLEAYPEHAINAKSTKSKRRERLLKAQLDLLDSLQQNAVTPPSALDPVGAWFDSDTSEKLIQAGMFTLQDLSERIALGGKWYRGMPAVGPKKALRVASFLQGLIGALPQRTFSAAVKSGGDQQNLAAILRPHPLDRRGSQSITYPGEASILAAQNDAEAMEEWVQVKSGSLATAKAYRKEVTRLLLWLQHVAGGKIFSEMTPSDCRQYIDFLGDIPQQWQSRARATPGSTGWAPFRSSQLSHKSRQHAIKVLVSFFNWLLAAQYIHRNPWELVNRKLGDDAATSSLDSKALSEGTMVEILRVIEAEPPSASRDRILFILRFVESVGLRSQELLQARLQDFRLEPEGLVLHVHGKGSKNRIAAIPGQAQDALQTYLRTRGLGGIEVASGEYPVLSSLNDPSKPVGYQALYEHVKRWLKKAARASALPEHERRKLTHASTHWLRHTFGTRAVAREVPLDVIQAQLGHASIKTTMDIYGRAPIKRRTTELEKAFRS